MIPSREEESMTELRSKPGHLVWRAYQLTWQIFAREAGDLDITPVQEALLLVLSEKAGVDQKTLADMLALDRSTAGDVLERLEKRGLLTRVENDQDRRAKLVSLTKNGKALSEKLNPIAARAADRLLSPLTPIERNEFKRLLRLITGLADPFDHTSAPPPLEFKLKGKQILCVGLSGIIEETLVRRLTLEGAEVVQLFSPHEPETSNSFRAELKSILKKYDGIEYLVNGGNLDKIPARTTKDTAFSKVQSLIASRWLTLEAMLPHFLNRGRGNIINLALFPLFGKGFYDNTAVVSANSAIIAMSNQIATDHRRAGIVCNCLSPRTLVGAEKQHRKAHVDVPAIDIALATSYLASDEARVVSGSNLILG